MKISQVSTKWPYDPDPRELSDSAFWVPGEESEKKAAELKKAFC